MTEQIRDLTQESFFSEVDSFLNIGSGDELYETRMGEFASERRRLSGCGCRAHMAELRGLEAKHGITFAEHDRYIERKMNEAAARLNGNGGNI